MSFYTGKYYSIYSVELRNGDSLTHSEAWLRYGTLAAWCRNQDIPFTASQSQDHYSLPRLLYFDKAEHATLFKLTFGL